MFDVGCVRVGPEIGRGRCHTRLEPKDSTAVVVTKPVAASVLVCPSALLPAVWKVATASFATENAYFAMTQEGATLQNYNKELVACIEEVR